MWCFHWRYWQSQRTRWRVHRAIWRDWLYQAIYWVYWVFRWTVGPGRRWRCCSLVFCCSWRWFCWVRRCGSFHGCVWPPVTWGRGNCRRFRSRASGFRESTAGAEQLVYATAISRCRSGWVRTEICPRSRKGSHPRPTPTFPSPVIPPGLSSPKNFRSSNFTNSFARRNLPLPVTLR